MPPTTGLNKYGHAYVMGVIAVGLCVIAASLIQLSSQPIPLQQWLLLAALTLISGSATIKLPSIPASISISETFVFTAVLLYGPAAGTLIVALDGLVMSFWIARRVPQPHRALFNMSAPAVSAWCSALLFFRLAGIEPLNVAPASLDRVLPALVVFAATYFGLNSWLITLAIAAHTHSRALTVWRDHFIWVSINYFCGASVAILLVIYTRNIDIRYLGVIVPLLFVLYFTFRTSLGRVEDANLHIRELNRLYLSTVETLAMAIDAKDQITHGHIRRVQAYALGLAQHLGVTDQNLVRAIEAAALLHDMGKLAVPEYILNKPGKLTAAEFEKMKLHATVGADILSAIEFPYPVVPIVRHHHEQWNGGGYPHGLRGTDIPIGARILAVVDCFDALTSDRPYRPRLSNGEALRILVDRRGSVYDPLIVDTFLHVHEELTPTTDSFGLSSQALKEIASSTQAGLAGVPPFGDIATSADEASTLRELTRALAGRSGIGEIGDIAANYIRRLLPFSLCVLYVYESATDELEASYAAGEGASIVRGLKISLGQHLSGWVAANRQTILNSDPVLDLGEIARVASPRLRTCLSTPLVSDDELKGVMTLYSSRRETFMEENRRIAEAVAGHLADALGRYTDSIEASGSDPLTELPDIRSLEQLLASRKTPALAFVLISIDVVRLKQINVMHGREFGDRVLRHVAQCAKARLNTSGELFRCRSDEFVALLNTVDVSRADEIAADIRETVRERTLVSPSSSSITIEIATATLRAPDDGVSLRELTAMARHRRLSTNGPYRRPSIH